MKPSHYPGFDVLAERSEWDATSRRVVFKRLKPPTPSFLREDEIVVLRAVAQNLLYESREDVLDFVVAHVDGQLATSIGESQRKATLPPQDVLVRRGVAALDAAAQTAHGVGFADCGPEDQAHLLQQLQKGKASLPGEFADDPQKDLFKTMLLIMVDALASHPSVWSEMGYPGPAYPRGYYRIERHRRDPWEPEAIPLPKRGDKHNGAG